MRIALYSLTRDRLELTRPCFESLWERAGLRCDHFVLDNGSTDGTPAWLEAHRERFKALVRSPENLGIARACNRLLDLVGEESAASGPYDLVIKVDNDCELLTPDLLTKLASALEEDPEWRGRLVLSPRVQGLVHQPRRRRYERLGQHKVGVTDGVGGIFLPVPWQLLQRYRYPEELPLGSGDDVHLCRWLVSQGVTVGYLEDLAVRHYLTTVGQWSVERRYFHRKAAEAAAGSAARGEGKPVPFEVQEHVLEGEGLLPVTVVVPLSAARRAFFEESCLPSLLENRPARVVVVEGEGGASAKRNTGFLRVETPFVFFCDDDVTLEPTCLVRLHAALTAPEAAAKGYAYCGYEGIVRPPARHPLGERFQHEAQPFDPGHLRRQNLASTMSLLRTAVFPGFDEGLCRLQDWDLWLTLLDRGIEGLAVPERLFVAYYLDQGITSSEDGEAARRAVAARHDLAPDPEADTMAISRGTARVLEELAKVHDLSRIVELGTGSCGSLATLLAAAPPHVSVVSVDHDPRFLERARARFPDALSTGRLQLVHAPLEVGPKGRPWYSRQALRTIPGPIDLLFVDGPEGAYGRAPALETFLGRLSPRAAVVLDDAYREEERRAGQAWEALLRERGHEVLSDLFPTDRGLLRLQLLGPEHPRAPVEVAQDPSRARLFQAARQTAARGGTVLDLGCGLGQALARELADATGGRVLGAALAPSLPLEAASIDLVLSCRRLEALPPEELGRVAKEVERVLRPSGRLLLAETVAKEGVVDARARSRYEAAFPWARLATRAVVPAGEALVGLLHGGAGGAAAAPAPVSVIDADDFHEANSGLELLFRIKGAVPGFKVTLFTIVGRCSREFLRGVQALDWIDLVPHGWLHETPLECQSWSYEEAREYLRRLEGLGLTRGFKAPGWQVSDGTYQALLEAGYWIADQRYNDGRRPSELPAYLLEDEAGAPVPGRRHYHVQDVCGNGLRERMSELLSLEGEFRFMKDVVRSATREQAHV